MILHLLCLFFFFGVVTKHLGYWGSHPASLRREEKGNTRGKCVMHWLFHGTVWDSLAGECRPHPACPGGHATSIPTKTPLTIGQFGRRSSLSLRQFIHVALASFSFMAVLLNIAAFVSILSKVSLLLMACVHLFCTSLSDCGGDPLSLCSIRVFPRHLYFPLSASPP